MGPNRFSALGAARAHRAAARALRQAPRLARAQRVRGRDRRVQPAPRPCLDAACDVLRLAGRGRTGRSSAGLLHPARADPDPRARRAVPRGSPPRWVLGAGAGAGAAVAAVALQAGLARSRTAGAGRRQPGPLARLSRRRRRRQPPRSAPGWCSSCLAAACSRSHSGACPARAGRHSASRLGRSSPPRLSGRRRSPRWVALKVGALSYGGGFVIIPLMQQDAVERYHWLTPASF